MSSPLSLSEVLESEHEAIEGTPLAVPGSGASEPDRLGATHKKLHEKALSALCLSGGGIRSATFALGVVQSLARHELLSRFHYLSTVSGGGYLGSWLTAWTHRHPEGLAGVCKELADPPASAPAPLRHLRDYSNYLSPRVGLLSADTWTLAATYLRNLLLNWFVLVPVLLVALAVPRFCAAVVTLDAEPWMSYVALALGSALSLVALVYIGTRRPSLQQPNAPGAAPECADGSARPPRKGGQGEFLSWCLAPLVGSAACLTTYWTWHAQREAPPSALELAGVVIAVHLAGWLVYSLRTRRFRPAELLVVVVTSSLAGLLLSYAANKVVPHPAEQVLRYVCVATPLFLGVFLIVGMLFVGLGSRWMNDDDREWAARMGAWILIAAAVWLVGAPVVIYGPTWFSEIGRRTSLAVSAAGGLSGLITILLGRSGKTPATKSATGVQAWGAALLERAPSLAAPLFVVFLGVLLTLLTNRILADLSAAVRWLSGLPALGFLGAMRLTDGSLNHAGVVMSSSPELVLLFSALMAAVALTMSQFINVNKYSLHSMYRNRLIRAYLGASRPDDERRPDLFTGFDPKDNIEMSQLWPKNCFGVARRRLFPVVNCALNLVSGAKLAWQERRAEPFTITPLHCGNLHLGYRGSDEYARSDRGDRGISLGTAVTISGAAASPNMGYHSSPVVTFLMALFNARLGWWLGNPGSAGEKTFRHAHPRQAVQPMIEEAFGLTDNRNPYVYLSDGGHFDNLGLYEMILRRCHLILVSDAGCDPDCSFEDLGNAIRKIRVDLGIPITFGGLPDAEGPNGAVLKEGAALGAIHYRCVDGPKAPDGVLLYLKPTLIAGSPLDARSYAKASPAFPHETTSDQWFSESQFESYRALGWALADQALAGVGAGLAAELGNRQPDAAPLSSRSAGLRPIL